MTNARKLFLMKLLKLYMAKNSSEYIFSRILKENTLTNNLFCTGCSVIFIPKVNCIIKMDEKKFTIKCKNCVNEFEHLYTVAQQD